MSIYKFGHDTDDGNEIILGYYQTPSAMYNVFSECILSKWNCKVDDDETTISLIDDVNDFGTIINWNQLIKLEKSKNNRIIKLFQDYAHKYDFEPEEAYMNDFMEFLDSQSKEYDNIDDMSNYIHRIYDLLLDGNLSIDNIQYLLCEPIEID